jgi:NAD(P)-dependent dehydrogenase (short-subunit alcohol dehydrogenase family)
MSTRQFTNSVIAITGAASGIGLATAHLLASRGANLSLADVQKEALEKVKAEIKGKYNVKVLVFPIDVRKYDQVEDWIAQTVKQLGGLDGAANLAGVIPKSIGIKPLAEQDFDEWEFVIGVNLTGVMHCLKAQLSVIKDNGSVVCASSIAGLTGRDRNGSYAASKHGVLGLTRSAAKEVGTRGIRVNSICP